MAVLEKAFIKAIDSPNSTVEFQFNPSKYSVNKSVQWKAEEAKGADTPPMEFVQGGARTVSMELFVDAYEGGGSDAPAFVRNKDVREFVKQLEELTLVDKKNDTGGDKPRPPRVEFHWANGPEPFPAVIKSLNVTYTMFHPDGRPARAKVSLSLQEIGKKLANQPGSSGGGGVRSHRVLPGETLDIIAYQELGDSRYWQHIAEINDVDNPLDIHPGQELVITPVR